MASPTVRLGVLLAGVLAFSVPVTLWSQAPAPKAAPKAPATKAAATTPTAPASPDEVAIRKVAAGYVAAFEKGDAAGVAACFTEDAEVLDISGRALVGRAEIEKALTAALAAQKGAKLQLSIDSLRIQKSGVAIEHGISVETRPGVPPVAIEYSATYAKEGGAWKIAALTESWPAPAPAAGDYLAAELGWLVGAWTSGAEGKGARTDFSWTDGGQFLLATHLSDHGGGRAGFEIIGWDPANRQIRSWAFAADGAFGEGRWTRDKDRWSVASQGVLPSGERTATTYLYTRIDDKTLELRAVNRTVNGAVAPALPPVKLVRAAH